MRVKPNYQHNPKYRGFSLVEVLVTMLVLSVGLLGFGSLQINALRNNQSAHYRSQATMLAYDILDFMRANQSFAKMGDYDLALNVNPSAGDSRAEQDLRNWIATVSRQLPLGDGSIQRNGNLVTVIVQWDDSRGENPALQFTVTSQL